MFDIANRNLCFVQIGHPVRPQLNKLQSLWQKFLTFIVNEKSHYEYIPLSAHEA